MDKSVLKYLYDIQKCICNIENYIGEQKVYEEYDANLMLQDAVERNIATIGEAMNKALNIEADIPVSNARKILRSRSSWEI